MPTARRRSRLLLPISIALAIASTVAFSAISPSADAVGPTGAYQPQPNRRFVTIGVTGSAGGARQFTEAELQRIATNYGVVVFNKGHANWDVAQHHAATIRLKQLNPTIKVYAYMSTKYWFDKFNWGVGVVPNPDWFLRDMYGELIPKIADGEDNDNARYVDLANPDYRNWILGVAQSWMQAAPYDGVRFDAADPVGDFGQAEISRWRRWVTPEKLAAYNAGIEDLLTRANAVMPTVLFNGISPGELRGPNRDLWMLNYTDGSMNERFCTTETGVPQEIPADISIMQTYAKKSVQQRAGVDVALIGQPSTNLLARLCLGVFFMGWQPGSTYFNFGSGYGLAQLDQQPAEVDLNVGIPMGAMVQTNALLFRRFEHGTVYVNTGTTPTVVQLARKQVEYRDGAARLKYNRGALYTVPAGDSAFFLDAAWVGM